MDHTMVRGKVALAAAGQAGACLLALLAIACQNEAKAPANTAPTPATHDRFPIASGPHAVECNTCHGDGASFREFNCTACHDHNQVLTDQLHKGVATYSYTAMSCFGCHADGSRQAFDHAGIAAGCADCHAVGAPFAALPFTPAGGGTFTHPNMNGSDCAACHSRTSWKAGAAPPGPVSDPAQSVLVNALVPTYAATSIASLTPQAETLAMPMNHASTALPSAVMSGCANCHVVTATGSYYPGKLHASLANLGLPQPAACLDCHSTSVPVGFVGPTATSPARVPPSGEMKHGAVAWVNGAPTTTLATPVECGLCHAAPQASVGHWSTSKSAGTTAVFHAALSAAAQPQPGSCIDCHANTRPSGILTAAVAALPSGVKFDHGASVALGDCVSCHTSSSSWTGGKFHLQGGSTPSSCVSCHEGERPTSTANWKSTTYSSAPFDYATHGDGLDCASCHTGSGTGAWGGTQNWVGGRFGHAASSIAGTTCIACHATQRPDLVLGEATAASLLPGNFDHAVKGASDCFSCHQATVAANAYVKYFNASGTLPGGDWAGGVGAPDGLRDPSQDTVVAAEVPSYAGTSIISVTARTETMPMPMYHTSAAVPSSMACDACHAGAASGNFFPGRLHASLASQPQTCLGCHAASVPVGFVGPIDARRAPASGEMKHDAVLWSNGVRTATPAVPQECAFCHLAPPTAIGWATTEKFHRSVATQPASCLDCHANSRPALLTSANAALPAGVQFDHSTATGECTTCHANGTFTSWAGGKFHLAGSATPSSCLSCHQGERPTSTAGWVSATYQTSPFDHATHGAGLDCVSCHAGPGTGAWGGTQNWVGGKFAHAAGSLAASSCIACHSSQRPDLVLGEATAASLLPGNFDHAVKGTADCFSCHQATVAARAYVKYFNASGTLPGGDWAAGIGAPDNVRDASQDVAVAAEIPTYSGTSITLVTARTETLPMPMFHSSATVPQSTACSVCHAGAATGTFLPGRLHASLASQPQTCLGCHAASVPVGFVGPIDARRTPASGAMKHDAVLWSGGAPTSTQAAPQECSLCHRSTSGWATAQKFHASVSAQPSSCLDCHANSRPALLTSANAALPAGVRFDHSTAMGECTTCHVSGSLTSWAGGKFHLAGSATPASCVSCHEGERPTSTANWKSTTWSRAPFDYGGNTLGKTHGDGLDCASCHAGPGTGAWGSTQNWVGGNFVHAASPIAGTTCIACHATQRPDLVLGQAKAASLLPGNFDHAVKGASDCFSCHQATVAANAYVKYFNASGKLPGGDWAGGVGTPDNVRDPSQDVAVAAEIPTYAGTSITRVTAQTETLPMPMFHNSAAVPQSMACSVCHAGAATGTFSHGLLHASLATQPAACLDCHAASAPAGFVGPIDARRTPASGEMKHDAVLWSNGVRTATLASPQECSLCHRSTSGWATAQKFHASVGAQPSSCLDCHANSRPALLTSANAALPAGVQFDHSTATGECTTCHVNGSFTSWTGGRFHLAGSATPASCLACHQGERPKSTAGWISPTYHLSPFDYATHGDGLDCASCHAGPGTGAWGGTQNWVGGRFGHAASSIAGTTCIACHATQRPDLVLGEATAASLLPGNFDHAVKGTEDCLSCHQATVAANAYVKYFNASGTLPGGDWAGGVEAADGVRDPSQDVAVAAEIPTYAGTSITLVTARSETLPMPMYHSNAAVPSSMACDACHAGAALGNFFPGRLHASLASQPQTCLGCHAASVPVGFVGPIDAKRTPGSGEMKHDAVLWSNGVRTATPAVSQECAFCHLAPPTAIGWATTEKFHRSVATQPASCLDCHANSRPALLTSANAALPAGVQFDHSTATGECTTCHVGGSFTSWTGGKFHLAGSATPTSCLSCHQGERPTSTAGWISATYQTSPFDYATHGAGQDCVTCHAGPGTGAWGGTQNWAGGRFAHAAGSLSSGTCIACHATQRPDLVLGEARAASLLPGNFDHAVKGTADCFSCHQATVAANAYVKYFNASGTLPGGDWAAGIGAPDNVRDASQDVAVAAEIPTYSGTSITLVTARTETLPMPMFHSSATVPQSTACSVCHAGAATGTFSHGLLHASLATQPTACLDCHAASAPAGFVGPIDVKRTPASGEMKHDAVLWSGGVRTATLAVAQECSLCHRSTSGWATAQKFHASVSAQPSSCLDCHANSRPALLTSANAALPAGVSYDHSTATGECTSCHASGSFASWAGGKFHLAGSATPASCVSCHEGERPTSTTNWKSTTYSSAPFDYGGNALGNTHGDGLECASCHAGPGTGAWGGTQNWVGGSFAHGAAGTPAASTCVACHSSQRPDLNGVQPSQLPGSFDHSANGATDCLACHQSTVSRGSYAHYLPIPGGDWRGGVGAPAGLTFDVGQDVMVTTGIPSWSGTSIVSVTPRSETLPMQMLHGSSQVPAAVGTSCANCHVDAASGDYYPGVFHASLTALGAAQPSACVDCHAGAAPAGFVGPIATNPARNPASAEMKHDAVAWASGKPGTTALVTQDCARCHLPPLQATEGAWGVGRSGATPALYHASLATAPSSCIDCHANSRPSLLTSAGAALPPGVQFDHTASVALADCVSCHASSSSWTGGKFHLQGGTTPSSCDSCHEGERPTSTANWKSTTWSSMPFDYGGNTLGNTHGDGLDCVSCHAGPGTGAWGSTQNWVGGSFAHGVATQSASTCVACHSSQRPDLNGVRPSQLPGSFDHASSGTGDCIGCHQLTVARASYLAYLPIPGGDWRGGVPYPGDTLIGPADQYIKETEVQLIRGTGSLVVGTSASTVTLYNQMLHSTASGTPPAGMPSQVYPGPAASPDGTKCWHCHPSSNGTVTSFLEGRFHSSLSNYSATPGGAVTPLPQPSTSCTDCHGQMRPAGIVEKSGSDLQAMDHSAAFTSGTTVAQMNCASCHQQPGNTWTDGVFHALIGSATPSDCVVCHYPLMADAAKADVASGTRFAMKHASTQLAIQRCDTCHATALSVAKTTPVAASLWQGGALHAKVPAQPTLCLDCHSVSLPASATQSGVAYRFATGGTSSNASQWMSHSAPALAGKDCAVCHLADAKASGAVWSKMASFHAAMPGVASCSVCHGLGNGSTTPGTNNNLPSGLTNSSTLTTASSNPTTGVPAGTHDQINHADVNVIGRDCNACHTQLGPSNTPGIQGAEWAQASFHAKFTGPLIMNGTTGRCSNCHMNVKPGANYTAEDHSPFTNASGSQDCSSCHAWPGTGSAAAPNWLGAAGVPATVTLTGWSSGTSITSNTVTFAHPSPSYYTSCAQCHAGSNFSTIIDYNHDGLTSNVTINGVTTAAQPNLGTSKYDASTNPTFCVHCHNTGSPWISKTGLSFTITANTTSGSTTVTTASTAALTQGMTISGVGIPSTTTTTTTFTANTASGSTTVTTASPVTLSAGTVISGPGIPPNDTVATSVNSATSFILTAVATATATGVTLTATRTTPLTVTIKSITSSTAFVVSSAANATATGTTLTVTHFRIRQAAIGNHGGSTNGEDCTSCHYVGGNERLTPPTLGVFGTGSISGN